MTMTPLSLPSPTNLPPTQTRQKKKSQAEIKAEREFITWVGEQFTQAKNARWRNERQWTYNLAFYFGQQNVQFKGGPESRSLTLWTPPAPYYRARPITNLIKPRVRKEISKLVAQKPTATVIPASNDEHDVFAAQAAEQLWESEYNAKKIHFKLRSTAFWTSIAGNGFLKTHWDPDYKSTYYPAAEGGQTPPGDICYEAITPFHLFFPDLKEEEIENQPYMIHSKIMNADMFSKKIGRPVALETAGVDKLDDNFLNVMQVQAWEKNKSILVNEIWLKPGVSNFAPEGGVAIIAANQIVMSTFEEGNPYEHGMYPFAHIKNVQTGKFYGDSVVNDLIPLQKEYNRTRGQIIESKNRMSKPQLAAEIGSINPKQVTSEPGQIILYRPGFNPPQPIPLQSVPNYVLEELDRIEKNMDDLIGQHEISRGSTPSGVTAATAISYLQEQDDSQLSSTFDSLEESVEKTARMSLSYIKQFWEVPRIVRVTGINGSFDAMTFKGGQLKDNTDIRIEAGSALPTSKAAKQALITDWMDKGYITPDKGMEVLDIGGLNNLYDQIKIDIRQAQRENLKMMQVTPELIQQSNQLEWNKWLQENANPEQPNPSYQQDPETQQWVDLTPLAMGMPPQPVTMPLIVPVNTWDNHAVHIEQHNNYRKSQQFDQAPDYVKELFEAHVQSHTSMLQSGQPGGVSADELAYQAQVEMQQQQASDQMGQIDSMGDMPSNPEGNNQFPNDGQSQQSGGQEQQGQLF